MSFKKGFTLIEVLAVVMIIGILSAVALPQYKKAVEKARVAEAQTTLKALFDSSERLASEFGYDNYAAMKAAANASGQLNGRNIGILRLDMFGEDAEGNSTLGQGRSINGSDPFQLDSTNYLYKLVVSSGGHNYVAAKATANTAYPGTLILFDRDTQDLRCQTAAGYTDACDVFGLDTVTGVSF